jgi:hypothetical protein
MSSYNYSASKLQCQNNLNVLKKKKKKINRYSYGVQLTINCTALDQSELSNFVECTIMKPHYDERLGYLSKWRRERP